MSRRTVNVEAGKNADVTLCTDEKTGDKTYTVSAKTDPTVTTHLSHLDNTVAKKADKTYVDGELAKKADKTYVNRELAKKADKTYVDGEIAKKADKTYVNTELAKKADKTYVDAELVKKADKTYVDTGLSRKADKAYVDTELAMRVQRDEMETALSLKVDKEPGKGLSENDYTDDDKAKLDSIGNYPAEEGGSAATLVTTGDKWSWDNKLDNTTYYLNGATVSEDGDASILTITGSDGTQTVFSVVGGHNAIETISADGTELPIIGRNVDIPLADANIPGEAGNAGLVRGTYETF